MKDVSIICHSWYWETAGTKFFHCSPLFNLFLRMKYLILLVVNIYIYIFSDEYANENYRAAQVQSMIARWNKWIDFYSCPFRKGAQAILHMGGRIRDPKVNELNQQWCSGDMVHLQGYTIYICSLSQYLNHCNIYYYSPMLPVLSNYYSDVRLQIL